MSRRCSYTVMEVIVATTIIMLIVGICTVNFSKIRMDNSPAELVHELRMLGALCRRSSVGQGVPLEISYFYEERNFQFGKERLLLPENVRVAINGCNPKSDLTCMRFFPNGSAAAVVIEFSAGEEIAGLTVSPLTGVMTVYEK